MPTPDLGEDHITALPDLKEGSNVSSDDDIRTKDTLSGTKRDTSKQSDCTSQENNQKQKMDVENDEKDQEENEGGRDNNSKRRRNAYEVVSHPPTNTMVARPMGGMKGHTAFLTFAVCPDSSDISVEKL